MKRIGAKDRSQIADFSASNDFPSRLASAFALVTDWSAAVSGNLRLEPVVATLGRQIGAAHLSIYRLTISDRKIQPALAVDRRDDQRPERISGSLASFAVTAFPDDVLPGKIFRLSELQGDPRFAGTAAEIEWAARPDIAQISVVVLGVEGPNIDILEILYNRMPDFNVDIPTAVIAIALSDAWSHRTPGLVLGLVAKFGIRNRLRPELFKSHVLSPDNPYALSRSQMRICQLLAAGQRPADIARLMQVSITTVRSHLRNIYAKTNTAGQFEVIALINGTEGQTDMDPQDQE